MTEPIVAHDLMKPFFIRLGMNHTLREVLGLLLNHQERHDSPRMLVVLKPDGSLAGLLTTRDVLRALLPEVADDRVETPEDKLALAQTLLGTVHSRLDLKVSEAMNPNVPVVSLRDRLPHLIETMRLGRCDSILVGDGGRIVGVVHQTDVFRAAAHLALSSQIENA